MYISCIMRDFSVPSPVFGGTQKSAPVPLNLELLACQTVYLDQWAFRLENDYWRFYVMSNNGWRVRFKSRCFPLSVDKVTVIPPDTPCTSESLNGATQFYICFRISNPFGFCKPGVYQFPRNTFEGLLRQLVRVGEARFAERSFQQSIILHQICYQALTSLPLSSWNLSVYPPIVTSAMDFLLRNMNKPISNQEVAGHIRMNRAAFIRRFHGVVGQTPQVWILKKRIEQAIVLLTRTDQTIDNIAEATGFFDRAHFSKVFKCHTTLTPVEYRRKKSVDYR